jgi:hypothetical protein
MFLILYNANQMVEISIIGDQLHLELKGFDKLWAFKSQLDIPLRHVLSVRHDPSAVSGWWHGIKLPGTYIPGVITAGTFYQNGQRVFWDVHDPQNSIIIQLHDDRFDELIVEVNDPPFAVSQIKTRLQN